MFFFNWIISNRKCAHELLCLRTNFYFNLQETNYIQKIFSEAIKCHLLINFTQVTSHLKHVLYNFKDAIHAKFYEFSSFNLSSFSLFRNSIFFPAFSYFLRVVLIKCQYIYYVCWYINVIFCGLSLKYLFFSPVRCFNSKQHGWRFWWLQIRG